MPDRALWKSLTGLAVAVLPVVAVVLASPHLGAEAIGSEARRNLLLDMGIISLMAAGLGMVNGVTGQFSLGHAGFQALGGYAAAGLFFQIFANADGNFGNPDPLQGTPPAVMKVMVWGAILSGGLFAAVTGVLVGMPTLRLRGDYLAIATLGFNAIVLVVIRATESIGRVKVGGATGLSGLPVEAAVGFADIYIALWAALLILWRVVGSTPGRTYPAVSEDEIAAEACGVDTTRTKVAAFGMGAFFAGVAGGLLAFKNGSVTPGLFTVERSIDYVAMVILGGGTPAGAAVMGAGMTWLINDVLDDYEKWRMPAYGFILVLVMTSRVQPLAGLLLRRVTAGLHRRGGAAPMDGADGGSVRTPQDGTVAGTGGEATPETTPQASPDEPATGRSPRAREALQRIARPGTAGESEPVLELRNAGVRFGGLRAVEGLDLVLRPGELVGLIGPNGAGKTTVFNLITGVYAPTEGGVLVRGRPVAGGRTSAITAAGVARTFQNIRLFRELSVIDNVRTAMQFRESPSVLHVLGRTPAFHRREADIRASAEGLLELFGLDRSADEPAGSLAYGDQRRLEIARALATKPALLLLDEPAAGMNPAEKARLMDLLRWVQSATGVTMLLIEHDMKLVMGVCRRIAVLVYGRKIAEGTPEEIRNDPKVIEAYLGEGETEVKG